MRRGQQGDKLNPDALHYSLVCLYCLNPLQEIKANVHSKAKGFVVQTMRLIPD